MTVTHSNLPPAPPGFRGLQPDLPVRIYYRHLPHWRQEGATYFVTFRLADSLPQEKLRLLKHIREEWERAHPPPRNEAVWKTHVQEVTRFAERWLDEGYGACHFRDRRWCDDLRDRLHRFQDERYLLSAWSIMPNHCHAVIRPYADFDLETLIGVMKGVTARHINGAIGNVGAIGESESYDRIVRDDEHLWRVLQYVGGNPRKIGLESEEPWRRWLHPEWQAAGWGFRDEP